MSLTKEKRLLIRAVVIKTLGGKCKKCGFTTDIEVHHIHPNSWGEGRGSTSRCWNWLDCLLDDSIELLCHDCHMEHHRQKRVTDEFDNSRNETR